MTNQHHNDIVLQFLLNSVAQRVDQLQSQQGAQFEQFARQQQDRIDQLEDALRESHLERQRLEEGFKKRGAYVENLRSAVQNASGINGAAFLETHDELYAGHVNQREAAFGEAIAPATAGKVIAADAQCVNCGAGAYSAAMPMDNDGNCLNCGESFTEEVKPATAPVEPTPEDANHRD